MIDRRQVLTLAFCVLAAPLASFAQQPGKTARIGFLGAESASSFVKLVEALRSGLRDLGYVEGKNIVIEFRWADGKYERLPELAAELVRLKVDLLVTHGTPGTLAAKRATTTIPIVMAASGDAVTTGLVASLARPGGNVTGSTALAPEVSAKRLELLKDAFPRARRVGVLFNPDSHFQEPSLRAMGPTAKSLKLELRSFGARSPGQFEGALTDMVNRRIDAVAVNEDGLFIANTRAIADFAAGKKLPSVGFNQLAEVGGLIGYGPSVPEMFLRAAYFVDKILKGAKPGDLPVEQPTRFELVLNLKTAKAMGIKFPQSILVRADRVIE